MKGKRLEKEQLQYLFLIVCFVYMVFVASLIYLQRDLIFCDKHIVCAESILAKDINTGMDYQTCVRWKCDWDNSSKEVDWYVPKI
jgi:hypothetical protein